MPHILLKVNQDELWVIQSALYEYYNNRVRGPAATMTKGVENYVKERYSPDPGQEDGYGDTFRQRKIADVIKRIDIADKLRERCFPEPEEWIED